MKIDGPPAAPVRLPFTKMQGLGNDFVVVDRLTHPEWPDRTRFDASALARKLCDRRFGVGADGLIFLEAGAAAPFRMVILNADGSEAEMCGNGLRCAGRLLEAHGRTSASEVPIETGAGVLDVSFTETGDVRVDAGPVRFDGPAIGMAGPPDQEFVEGELGEGRRGTAVSVGNPHLVMFVEDVSQVDLGRIGPELEHHALFPNRINVHVAQVLDRGHVLQRTWERGAGLTLACGTGACAVVAAGFRTGRNDREVEVQLPGGRLKIDYLENGHAAMTGPACVVFEGEIRSPRLVTYDQAA